VKNKPQNVSSQESITKFSGLLKFHLRVHSSRCRNRQEAPLGTKWIRTHRLRPERTYSQESGFDPP